MYNFLNDGILVKTSEAVAARYYSKYKMGHTMEYLREILRHPYIWYYLFAIGSHTSFTRCAEVLG